MLSKIAPHENFCSTDNVRKKVTNFMYASKCMDFFQALAKQGQAFNFSLTVSSGFSFSLDTRRKAGSPVTKKKTIPSTLRRNTRRREEFLAKKEVLRGLGESRGPLECSSPVEGGTMPEL